MDRDLRVTPPFRAVDRRKGSITLSGRRWNRHRAREAVERRAIRAGDEGVIGSGFVGRHGLRATGITANLEHPDSRAEVAQYLAGHARMETKRLHDRREEQVSLDEVERSGIWQGRGRNEVHDGTGQAQGNPSGNLPGRPGRSAPHGRRGDFRHTSYPSEAGHAACLGAFRRRPSPGSSA